MGTENQAPLASVPARVVIVVTAERTAANFVMGYARFIAKGGSEVTVIANGVESLKGVAERAGVSVAAVPMRRDPSPARDLVSLWRIFWLLRRLRPDVLVYATPKASLLASIAGRACGIPTRVYELWGLRLETSQGLQRRVLSAMERLTSRLSGVILANSGSLAERYRSARLNAGRRVIVPGAGSSHGVDVMRFSREATSPPLDPETALFLATPRDLTIGYVGRLHRDKGIDVLLDAVARCRGRGIDVALIIVGGREGVDPDNLIERHGLSGCVRYVGVVADPRPYYSAIDVLALLSFREGFPNVVLEAASMGVPALVSDGTGVIDSVVDGKTGIVVPVGDVDLAAAAIEALAKEPDHRRELGKNARTRVEKFFEQEGVWHMHAAWLLGAAERGGDTAVDGFATRGAKDG